MKAPLRFVLGSLLAASLATPAYADSVKCADGTSSERARGACSHHGGIATKTEARHHRDTKRDDRDTERDSEPVENSEKPMPADHERDRDRNAESGPVTARCKDGHFSHSAHHSGTCSGHGGVAEWLAK
jgi:hypothetical protein